MLPSVSAGVRVGIFTLFGMRLRKVPPSVIVNSKITAQKAGIKLLDTSDTYYELLPRRIPGLQEDIEELKQRNILVDGKPGELLLQIFSENQLGPIFFEFIQRKGNEGFGEGNFKALFETMELDQMRRGVLPKDAR